jgi:hypothetical protein
MAAIDGVPIICDQSGMAFPVSSHWENLLDPQLPDRKAWYDRICHTEWTLEEIASGEPLMRIAPYLELRLDHTR